MITCNRCGHQSPEDAVFCDQCGARLSEQAAPVVPADMPETAAPMSTVPTSASVAQTAPQSNLCPSCGASVTPGEMFCSECGAPLEAPTPEPMAPPQPTPAPVPAAPAATPTVAPTTPVGAASDRCPFCGAPSTPGETFCYACGAQLSAESASLAQAAPAADTTAPVVTPVQPPTAPVAPTTVPTATAPTVSPVCTACGAQIPEGQAFCPFCGAAVAGATQQAFAAPQAPTPTVSSARLVVLATNAELVLPAGSEIVIGREDPYSGIYPDVDLTPHGGEEGGISRRHFKIHGAGNQYTIEDLNSTNLTLVNQNRLQPGVRTPLHDGDEIRAGRVRLVFRIS